MTEDEYAKEMVVTKVIVGKVRTSTEFTDGEKRIIMGALVDRFVDKIEEDIINVPVIKG